MLNLFKHCLKYIIISNLPSKKAVEIRWNKHFKNKPLNLNNPTTFNEKIQWLKLYYRNPLLTICSDKLRVRDYVKEKIGVRYLNELLKIYNHPREINWFELPRQFVLKLNHDSGSVAIIKDKNTANKEKVTKKLSYRYRINYGKFNQEWGYINIKPKVLLVEKYLGEVRDYKVFCFNGVPKMIQVDLDRFTNHTRNLYTTNWEWIDLGILYPKNPSQIEERPICLEEMLEMSKRLSSPFPHVRVDWYIVDCRPIFGEMTFYHGSGYEQFDNQDWEYIMGEWIGPLV